jgi:hypothetical protein
MLRVNVLREYLEKEMKDANYSCVGGFDLERFIDDFIFMCFFVGNDFLPHLPTLEIREGAIDTFMDLYKQIFSKLGGYLTDVRFGGHSKHIAAFSTPRASSYLCPHSLTFPLTLAFTPTFNVSLSHTLTLRTQSGDVRLDRVEVLLKDLSTIEALVLRRRREKEQGFKKKDIDIANKTHTQDHLRLIRACTAVEEMHPVGPARGDGGSVAVKRKGEDDGAGDGGEAGEGDGKPPRKVSRQIADDTGIHGGVAIELVPAEAFRVKHRGVGGVRVVQQHIDEQTRKKLFLLDKVREFADDTSPQRQER